MFDIQNVIDQWIFEKEIDEDSKRDRDCWSASSMGMCPRERYWTRQGKQSRIKEPMAWSRQRMVGKILHELLNRILSEKGLLVAGEQELRVGSLVGHFDAIVRDEEGAYHLLDHKTVNSKALDFVLRTGPGHHRKLQLATYAWMIKQLKPELFEKIKSFQLGFLSRDDCRLINIGQILTPKIEKEIKDEIEYLDKCWKSQSLPTGSKEPWQCKRCRYRDQCDSSKVEAKPEKVKMTKIINL